MRRIAVGPIHCVEHHDGAYAVCRAAGVSQRQLIHIDAHHDLYGTWIDPKRPQQPTRINIANFIYAALAEKLVREVIWVVPDETWGSRAGRSDIVRNLRRMDQGGFRKSPKIRVQSDRIIGTALGCSVQVCTLENLPSLDALVLLDIDIDYLIIPNVGYRGIGTYGERPWCWLVDLLARLESRGVRTDLTTIAFSVEGGYTPLQWKYLGDELAERLKGSPTGLTWADAMRRAAEAAGRGDFPSAEIAYREAQSLRPTSAAPWFHLAHLYAATGRIDQGAECLKIAYATESSYRTAFNNSGLWYLGVRRYVQARAAFNRILELDPQDAAAHLGLGLIAIKQREWSTAESSLRRALQLDDRSIDAHRALGRVLNYRKDYPAAIAAYERSLKLALIGQRAITDGASLGMVDDSRMPSDSAHASIHAELARLHAANGAKTKAIAGYRMAIGMGLDTAGAWGALAGLYLRSQRWSDAIAALLQWCKRAPRDCWRWIRRRWRKLQKSIRLWRVARSMTNGAGGAKLWP